MARNAPHVLIVDDEASMRELYGALLSGMAYRITFADNGKDALHKIAADAPDVLVLDLSMPEMSGEEAFPELRKIRSEVEIVVTSGYSEAEAMDLFGGQRVCGFIQKPYTAQGIAEKVKRCLE